MWFHTTREGKALDLSSIITLMLRRITTSHASEKWDWWRCLGCRELWDHPILDDQNQILPQPCLAILEMKAGSETTLESRIFSFLPPQHKLQSSLLEQHRKTLKLLSLQMSWIGGERALHVKYQANEYPLPISVSLLLPKKILQITDEKAGEECEDLEDFLLLLIDMCMHMYICIYRDEFKYSQMWCRGIGGGDMLETWAFEGSHGHVFQQIVKNSIMMMIET